MPFDAMPETQTNDVIKLRIALDGLSDKRQWAQGSWGTKRSADHCLLGWLLMATDYEPDEATRLALDYVWPSLPEKVRGRPCGSKVTAISNYNDSCRTRHGDVVALLERAIEKAGA